jgi:acetoin utilization deacetylase AcuC-like enzyme
MPVCPAVAGVPPVLLVDDARFERHTPLGHHPERPARLVAARAAVRAVEAEGVAFARIEPRAATDDELGRVHAPRFVEALGRLDGRSGYIDPDTYVSPESVALARQAAGALVATVDALLDPSAPSAPSKAVALVRPPGHHARPAQSMGFCLLNNVAVAAAHARARGLGRVAVVDWDVHHGNGTQEMFYDDPHVLYVSTHQHPFYPGTGDVDEVGRGEGAGYTVNVPLGAGSGDAVYRAAFERVVLPVLEAYAPELVLVSAGFDASAADPLAQMQLTDGAFGWMAAALAGVASGSARGRIVLVLEGGYDLVALEGGLRCALEGMLSVGPARALPAGGPGGADETGLAGVDRAARWAEKTWRLPG